VRPVSLPIRPHPLSGNHLARVSRLARASALLLMQCEPYRVSVVRSTGVTSVRYSVNGSLIVSAPMVFGGLADEPVAVYTCR
jgi:hypothetical protein